MSKYYYGGPTFNLQDLEKADLRRCNRIRLEQAKRFLLESLHYSKQERKEKVWALLRKINEILIFSQ